MRACVRGCVAVQEVEESRRLYAAQKRALKEALAAAAEAEASHQQAEEAQRVVVDQVRWPVPPACTQRDGHAAVPQGCGLHQQLGC